jgi:hypothetical protein
MTGSRPITRFAILPVRHVSVHSGFQAGEIANIDGRRRRKVVAITFSLIVLHLHLGIIRQEPPECDYCCCRPADFRRNEAGDV